jgi:hypothetical protein
MATCKEVEESKSRKSLSYIPSQPFLALSLAYSLTVFLRHLLSILMMHVAGSSETLVHICKITRSHSPQDNNFPSQLLLFYYRKTQNKFYSFHFRLRIFTFMMMMMIIVTIIIILIINIRILRL